MAGREYTVVIARYGTRTARRSEVFLNYAQYGEPDGPIEMDYFIWIARDAERTIVIDTGFSRRGGDARGRTMLHDPCELFDQIGVDRKQATVVVTHAHYDHVGNLQHFPTGPVIIAERELAFWTGPLATRPLFHHSVEDSELGHLADLAKQGRITTFEGDHEVAPGIEVIELGGHTPGQSAVRIHTSLGNVLLTSDAAHYQEELDRDMPFSSVTSVVDMYAGLDRIRRMQASGEVDVVVTGHDPGTLARFAPVEGSLAGSVATIGGPL